MVHADLMSQRSNFKRARDFFRMNEQTEKLPGCPQKEIMIKNVTLRRPDCSILYKIPELNVHGTGLVLIQGENGCGKSTLFNIFSGVFSEEQVEIGKDGDFQIASEYRGDFAYLFYPNFIFPGTVKENILCGRKFVPEVYHEIEKILHLPPTNKEVHTKPENLSLGEKQKIFLARILIDDHQFLLLDEPGSNLDDQTEKNFARELEYRKKEKLIMVISHNKIYDEIADQIYIIQDGIMQRKR